MPKLRMIEYNPSPPRVHGDFAIHGGDYTFAWQGADGATVEVLARFTFAYRKENGEWHIVEHHSSKMPDAPPALKAVSTAVGDSVVPRIELRFVLLEVHTSM